MDNEELVETLRNFTEKQVNELPGKGKMVFYAIMDIADERDELKEKNKKLKMQLYSKDQIETKCPKCGEKFTINQCRVVANLEDRINKAIELVDKLGEYEASDEYMKHKGYLVYNELEKVLKGEEKNK